MKVYYITGTSRGLGLALAEALLSNEDNLVIGIGRQSELNHANYRHKRLDLSDIVEVSKFRFAEHVKAESATLINNAGTLGEINHVGRLDNKELASALNVNLVAPVILMNNFISGYQEKLDTKRTILNISSGAGVAAYDGWGAYCTSKAGVNMISEVAERERVLAQDENLRILSIAPGIIETNMQAQIRDAKVSNFSNVDRFVELKEHDLLQSPQETAEKLIQLLNSPISDRTVFQDLRQ